MDPFEGDLHGAIDAQDLVLRLQRELESQIEIRNRHIRRLRESGVTGYKIANMLGLSETTVGNITRRHNAVLDHD